MILSGQRLIAGVFSVFGARTAFVSGFSHGLPRAPLSAGQWRKSLPDTTHRGCRGRGARGFQVLRSDSIVGTAWRDDRPAGGHTDVLRRFNLMSAGCRGQARRLRRRGMETGGSDDRLGLRMASDPAVRHATDSGNSTAEAFAGQQAMLQGRSPPTVGDLGDVRHLSGGDGGAERGATEAREATAVTTPEVSARRERQNILRTLWQFSRPHTMIGTAIAIPTMGVFAAPQGIWLGSRFFLAMAWAIVPSLLINIYITGLNQVMDVEIDRINKPYLPIPAGHLTRQAAKVTVTLCLLAGVALGFAPCSLGSTALTMTVALSVIIGTSYSLPPLRLKRFPQIAALCILVVRGSVINGGFYTHAQTAAFGLENAKGLTAAQTLTVPLRDAKCALALAYFTVFAVVIALMKDVPDVAGDRQFNIRSFSVVMGEAALFRFARSLLTALLWGTSVALAAGSRAAAAASLPWIAVARGFVATSALVSGQLVRKRADGVDPKQPSQVYAFYMFLWKIFYASYFFLPLAR